MTERPENGPRFERPGDEEREIRRLLEAAGPRDPLPEDDLRALREEARTAWRNEVEQTPRGGSPARGWILALAAALIAVAGVGWWWVERPATEPAPEVARILRSAGDEEGAEQARSLTAGTVLRTGFAGDPDARLTLRMDSGVEVRLDHSTAIVLASAAAIELERGAVYVDTGEGRAESQAIEVRTPLGIARDVGTRFVVRYAPREEAALQVRVRDGEVVVERNGIRETASAGRELVVRADGSVDRRARPRYGEPWNWVLEAAPPFAGATVGDLLRWVARETGWEVRFTPAGLASRVDEVSVHGATGRLRPDEAPFVVLPAAGLRGELRDGVLVVEEAE